MSYKHSSVWYLPTTTAFVLVHLAPLISADPDFPAPVPVNEQNENNYQLLHW